MENAEALVNMENVEVFINEPNHGMTTYRIAGSETFNIPNDESKSDVAKAFFSACVERFADLVVQSKKIMSDFRYSEQGKAEKLEPFQAKAIEMVAHAWDGLTDYENSLNSREEKIIAFHGIDPSHSALAIEDREIRDWWRSLPAADRAKMLGSIQNETGHDRIMLALLRSPVALIDHEIKSIRNSWEKARRAENPDEVFAIDEGRKGIEWARRALAIVGVFAKRASGWDNSRIMKRLLMSERDSVKRGYFAFGLTDYHAAETRRIINAEQRKRA